jgi:hypothetical protein
MDKNEENLGILRELMAQQTQKVERRVSALHTHGAAQTNDTCLFPEFHGTWPTHNAFQSGKGFLAMPLLGESDCLFRISG